LRIRTASAVLVSLIPGAIGVTNAFGANTGGVAPGTSTSSSSSAPSSAGGAADTPGSKGASKPPPGAAPVTARTSSVAYHGPVYERTLTGQVLPYEPLTEAATEAAPTGGSAVGLVASTKPELLVPGSLARYVEGLAAAPMNAPAAVQEIIWAGDQLIGLPYIYGGGHASFVADGYDCSGTVSYALHGANLLAAPLDSTQFMTWGVAGPGAWITVYAQSGHVFLEIAGIRLDTSAAGDPGGLSGPRWRPLLSSTTGYVATHPTGY
jgi:cell wall-associated NlpC family hydrolase